MPLAQVSYIGKGNVFLRLRGLSTARTVPIGNTSALSISTEEDRRELQDFTSAGGGVLDTYSVIRAVNGAATVSNLDPSNLALALRGSVAANISVTPISSEIVAAPNVQLGSLVRTARLINRAAAVVVRQGANTIAPNNYRVMGSGIWINPVQTGAATGQITAGIALSMEYTPLADSLIQALVALQDEYEVIFDGLNEVRSGRPVVVTIHRVKFSPTQGLNLIGDDFANLEMAFQAMADSTITGTGLSQYMTVRMADQAA